MHQSALRDPGKVDIYKRLMLGGHWDFAGQGQSFVFWKQGRTVWVAEGHHRMNAALEIGRESGDWSFLHRLLEYGSYQPYLPPPRNRGWFPTRGFWSWCLAVLGW